MFPFSRSTSEFSPSTTLNEAILASSSSVRDSLPEQHREHFETLRQEIIDFAQAHGIPKDALAKPDALREAAQKLSIPDLQRLATLLERFEYLLVYKEPRRGITEALEYVEKKYHLLKQYDSQVKLLTEVGILNEGVITGIDQKEYPIPTLEQIAQRIFERRETFDTKHDQGFTKLLLVPFGMSLDSFQVVLDRFLFSYKKSHPTFGLAINDFLSAPEYYQGADTGGSPKLVYYPKFFDEKGHQGKTKMQILGGQEDNQNFFPGWTIHLLQPSDPSNPDSLGFAPIPRKGQGEKHGKDNPRFDLEAGKRPVEYLSIFQKFQNDPTSSYYGETSFTPEDWIIAFMTHLTETGQPLDDYQNDRESISCVIGAFFPFSVVVPVACWVSEFRQVSFDFFSSNGYYEDQGVRSSVIV